MWVGSYIPVWLRRRDRGIAALEFGFVAPLLITLVFGAATVGTALRAKMMVGNAARAGIAYAINHGYDATNIPAAAKAATGNAALTVTPTQYTNSCINSSGVISTATGATCPNGSPPGVYVKVAVSQAYSLITPFPGNVIPSSYTLTSTVVARIQ